MKKDFSFEIKRTRRRSKLNKPSIWKGVDLTAPSTDDANTVTETPAASGDSRRHTDCPRVHQNHRAFSPSSAGPVRRKPTQPPIKLTVGSESTTNDCRMEILSLTLIARTRCRKTRRLSGSAWRRDNGSYRPGSPAAASRSAYPIFEGIASPAGAALASPLFPYPALDRASLFFQCLFDPPLSLVTRPAIFQKDWRRNSGSSTGGRVFTTNRVRP